MDIINEQFDLKGFYLRFSSGATRLLMLDYDGTLAPFTAERDKAFPYAEIIDTMERLLGSNSTRVVLISGRTVDDLKKLLNTERLPEIWGCHGLERLTRDGQYSIVELSEEMRQGLSDLYNWTAENQLVNFFEFKPSGGAFHWRGLPEDEVELVQSKVTERWKSVAESAELEMLEFDGGIEIRVSGTNKSVPVIQLLAESGDDTVAAYLGDDLTDEDAFHALKGKGLAVLVNELARETEADIRITPPDELNEFLQHWV